MALHHRQRHRYGCMSAANGRSATGVMQPALQCRSNDLSALLPHKQEKAEVPWQVSGPAVGCMPSSVDQHEANCELPDETSRGDRLIEGLRPKITTQPLRSFIPPHRPPGSRVFHLRLRENPFRTLDSLRVPILSPAVGLGCRKGVFGADSTFAGK